MEKYSLISLWSLAFAPFVTYTQFSLLLSLPPHPGADLGSAHMGVSPSRSSQTPPVGQGDLTPGSPP